MSVGDQPAIPWVRVIIVNYNGGALLQACIDHLARQTFTDFEAVVVDNQSTDGSAASLTLPDGRFRLIHAGRNLGFAAGNNLGAAGCAAPWLATLNPDALAEIHWLDRLHEATERHSDAWMFGSTQIDGQDPERLDGCGDVLSIVGLPWRGAYQHPISALPPGDGECFSPCAAAALYRRQTFEALGGFDDRFFCYIEDVDLGFRFRLAGGRGIQVREARVAHIGSAISGRNSAFTLYHSYRNRVWLIIKTMPGPLVLPVLALHLAAVLYLLWRTHRNRQDELATCIRGLADGVRGSVGLLGARHRVQRTRRIPWWRAARALTWSLAKLRSRSADLRPR